MNIRKKHLIPGAIIKQGEETLKLIEHSPSWRPDEIPYCLHDAAQDRQHAYSFQRWKVEIDGFVTHRNVHYYIGVSHYPANCKAWARKETD